MKGVESQQRKLRWQISLLKQHNQRYAFSFREEKKKPSRLGF
jgi:hypothetical protein